MIHCLDQPRPDAWTCPPHSVLPTTPARRSSCKIRPLHAQPLSFAQRIGKPGIFYIAIPAHTENRAHDDILVTPFADPEKERGVRHNAGCSGHDWSG